MKILNFHIHKKMQDDIIKGGISSPIIVIGYVTANSYSRLFCLWSGGVWLRWIGKKRFVWRWSGTR